MQQRKRAKLKLRDSCDGCSEAKTKCNKEKPVCSRCHVKGLTCCYGPSHRSGRRSADASKAFERSRKSPAQGLVPAPAYFAAPTSPVVSSSNDINTTTALNSTSNSDFSFSIDAFDFPDIAFDGAAPGTTPFTYSPELLKMSLSAPEYEVAAFMSTNPEALNNNNSKGDIDNSNSGSKASFTYDNRNDSRIGSDLDSMTYDPQWLNNPGVMFQNNFGSGLSMPPSSSYAPQMNLPDISTSSSLQSSIYNHQASAPPNANTDAILGTTSPKTPCTCLTEALSLLAALHGNTDASSSTCSPIISPQTPPYAENNNKNTTTLRNLGGGGGGTGVKSAATATIQECLTLNTSSLQQATKILNCDCSSRNQQLIFFIAFITLKTMDRYTAAAQGADTLDRNSDGNGKCSSRALAQLVLGELHRVVRIVDTLSKRMREGQGRRGSGCSGSSSSQSGRGEAPEVGAGGPLGGPGGYDISASCFAQLENDLRKHLKAVTNDTMAVLRREQE